VGLLLDGLGRARLDGERLVLFAGVGGGVGGAGAEGGQGDGGGKQRRGGGGSSAPAPANSEMAEALRRAGLA
ncbi:hypothetical protein HLB32_10530, partial [Streptomyces cacaoi]|uniref:hypothetical protein n=1 Tax=Streptomyces cacaoi TaxID=1898 RepID=UPI0014790455